MDSDYPLLGRDPLEDYDAAEALPSEAVAFPNPSPPRVRNALRNYSLLGKACELEANAVNATPLLGEFVMRGQATMIYAAPNTGKTLITLSLSLAAVAAQRIDPANLYYINADDSSEGLATKVRLLQDVGAHTLAPGHEGFRTDDLIKHLDRAVEDGAARDTCVIIDTLKKFTDLMDKKRTREFADGCRRYVMAGGTIVALGHTAKNPNADGSLRYQGGTDVLEDFDAVYMAEALTSKANASEKVAKLSRLKCRAESPALVAYVYDESPGTSYEGKLASLRSVDLADLDDYAPEPTASDPVVMEALVELIKAGSLVGKMALAKAAAKDCGVSHRAAIDVLERHTGDTPHEHLWNFDKGDRGVRIYRLIDQGAPPESGPFPNDLNGV